MTPNYLVQTQDMELFPYWRLDILLCDVAPRRDEPISIFKRIKSGFTDKFVPVSCEELKDDLKKGEGQ